MTENYTAKLYTFCEIFDDVKEIVIPQIQRDYAQGRENKSVERIRGKFLDALYNAVEGKPITLDFIYGDRDEDGVMTPLDGQQRLTTLFLLHVYACKKQKIPREECAFLDKFSYRTRFSARDFCKQLVDYDPKFCGAYAEEIRDQSRFAEDWNGDPTVSGMLVMLDCIQQKFSSVENLWQKLKGGAIKFYFEAIGDMGLTDELYIKMNSRGKPLTVFEHFKAELARVLGMTGESQHGNENYYSRIIQKIDGEWTGFLWRYREETEDNGNVAEQIDLAFMNYFRYIVDLIRYKKGEFTQSESVNNDEFAILSKYFTGCADAEENILFLENAFDIWLKEPDTGRFFGEFSADKHQAGKIIYRDERDILADCFKNYADFSDGGTRERNFTYKKMLLLLCYLTYLKENVQIADFKRRLRIISNLINNSDNELTERVKDYRMPAIVKFTQTLIATGKFYTDEVSYNTYQVEEERKKLEWTEQNPQLAEELFALEDHELLYGQIGIVGLDKPELFPRFTSLFACPMRKVNRALYAAGDYRQHDNSDIRYRMGGSPSSSVWKTLLHNVGAKGYENTARTLRALLKMRATFTEKDLDDIAEKFLAECESSKKYIWRYYFVKYPQAFMPDYNGKYIWFDGNKPYECTALAGVRYRSAYSYNPYLAAVGKGELSHNPHDEYLLINGTYVRGYETEFTISDADKKVLKEIKINMKDGVDTEDRVERLRTEF